MLLSSEIPGRQELGKQRRKGDHSRPLYPAARGFERLIAVSHRPCLYVQSLPRSHTARLFGATGGTFLRDFARLTSAADETLFGFLSSSDTVRYP